MHIYEVSVAVERIEGWSTLITSNAYVA